MPYSHRVNCEGRI